MKHRKIVILLAVIVFLASPAYALNFGSSAKTSDAAVHEGEKAVFTLIFWTTESEDQIVDLSVKSPENMNVSFGKNNFIINKNTGEERISVSGEYIHATPASVIVDTSRQKEGNYTKWSKVSGHCS